MEASIDLDHWQPAGLESELSPKEGKPIIVCVDDERHVLEGLALHLRRHFDVRAANCGEAGLALINESVRPAVILSDMRMPGMNGAQFLAAAREKVPRAQRILLTGHTDISAAIAAVNEGQIFRFLNKPCPPPELLKAALAAAEQFRLLNAEHELLQHTLLGSIRAMTDILFLSNPEVFGRATRIRRLIIESAAVSDRAVPWQLDVAAMLSQIGWVALPAEVAGKLASRRALSLRETGMAKNAQDLGIRLINHIPRLEEVAALLQDMHVPWSRLTREELVSDDRNAHSAQWLRVAAEFDALQSAGHPAAEALAQMRAAKGQFNPLVMDSFQTLYVDRAGPGSRECPIHALAVGMVLAEDVYLNQGGLLASRGYEITAGFLERLINFKDSLTDTRFLINESE